MSWNLPDGTSDVDVDAYWGDELEDIEDDYEPYDPGPSDYDFARAEDRYFSYSSANEKW